MAKHNIKLKAECLKMWRIENNFPRPRTVNTIAETPTEIYNPNVKYFSKEAYSG